MRIGLDAGLDALKPANRKKVQEALEAIVHVLNGISEHYMSSQIMFDFRDLSHGAVSLLYVIDDGLKAKGVEEVEKLK